MLTTNPEYDKLIPPLPDLDYKELKKSIQKDGLYYPIIINEKNEVLDGHHRFKACKELGIEPITEVKKFDNHYEEKKFVIRSNFNRRHLTVTQRAVLADELHKLESDNKITVTNKLVTVKKRDYKREDRNRKKPTTEKIKQNKQRTSRQRVAKQVHLSDETLRQFQYVKQHGSPELVKDMLDEYKPIRKSYELTKKETVRKQLETAKLAVALPEGVRLINDDFRNEVDIPDESVDLIFTDPPYGEESIPLYKDLGEFASRVLKPGGSLVTYTGQITMSQVMRGIEESSLKYWWVFCVKHAGNHQRIHPRMVFAEWKPLLWYVKGDKANVIETIGDYILSTKPDKLEHDWEQSTLEADHVIERLSTKNQIVLDPFLGSGTTGLSALKLKRNFIGIEKDTATFKIAKSRIGKFGRA